MQPHMQQKFFLSLSIASTFRNSQPDGENADDKAQTSAPNPKTPLPPVGSAQPDFHKVAYVEWGDPQGEHIICVHGLARNARDFDPLAERLSRRACVVCPDIVGRGRSDWLRDPDVFFGYTYAQYMSDITALIARLGADQVDWVGTSLGGLLGMMMAAAPRSPVRRLVMNDVGPQVPVGLWDVLLGYLASEQVFGSPDDLRQFIQDHYCGVDKFGVLTEAQLRHMTKYSERKLSDGKVGLAFDHEVMRFPKWMQDNNQLKVLKWWDVWKRVRCPVLVLRGENSGALEMETAERMRKEGPRACVVTIPGCGHAPSLMSDAQITLVDTWLKTMEIDRKSVEALGASLQS